MTARVGEDKTEWGLPYSDSRVSAQSVFVFLSEVRCLREPAALFHRQLSSHAYRYKP